MKTISAKELRHQIEIRAAIDRYCRTHDGPAFPPDGTEVCKGITYRVKDGEGYYEVSPEFREHVRKLMGD